MNRKSIALAVLFCVVIPVGAQTQDRPMPDRWRGLVIDQSSPDDAMKTLGAPATDKTEVGFKPTPLEKRISAKGKTFRHLWYKELPGLKSAHLVFTDNRLVCLTLELKEKIAATAVPNNYGIDFEPKISGFDTAIAPEQYERHQGKLYPKEYPDHYFLIGTTDKVWVVAAIDNDSMKSLLFGSSRGSTGEGAFPGKAGGVMILSRSLANREGADVLK